LTRLLEEFGPPRRSAHPELPFYHLQNDGVWEIEERIPLTRRRGSKNPLRTELRKWSIRGGFTEDVFEQLRARPEAIRELAREPIPTNSVSWFRRGSTAAPVWKICF